MLLSYTILYIIKSYTMKLIFRLLTVFMLLQLSIHNLRVQTLNNIPCTRFNVDSVVDRKNLKDTLSNILKIHAGGNK